MPTQAISSSSIVCLARHNRRSMMQAWSSHAPVADATEFLKGMHHESAPATEHALRKDQILSLPESRLMLECLSGSLWLTREGDIDDYFLGAGERVEIWPEEGVVVQALNPSQVRWIVA
ncbi:MAG: DUF2917 domain-containing protein [Sulfuritalea sp.]|nr:DUF2917 domain-containing protein [Sulfuritalea sp.]